MKGKGYFYLFLTEAIILPSHLNCLDETVQMRGHNVWFYAELSNIILNYYQGSVSCQPAGRRLFGLLPAGW